MLEIDNLIFETGTEESERKAARGGDSESGTELQRLSVVIIETQVTSRSGETITRGSGSERRCWPSPRLRHGGRPGPLRLAASLDPRTGDTHSGNSNSSHLTCHVL